jgi:hypothetical protein
MERGTTTSLCYHKQQWSKIMKEETRQKISIALTGRKLSQSHIENLKNRKFSEEHKRKMSKAKMGKKRKPFSAETRQKMSESKRNVSEETRLKRSEAMKLYWATRGSHRR